ncbi:hypothetical protein ACOSQ3_018542 [Xanthoceras sorbifolium]
MYHFPILNPKTYTLQTLICDVYLLQCSTLSGPGETFRTEIHVSWTGHYELVEDDVHLQQLLILVDMDLLPLATMPKVGSEYHAGEPKFALSSYRITPRQNTSTNNVVYLLSDDDDVNEDTEYEEDEAYNPFYGGWIIHNNEEGMDLNDGQNAVEVEVHDDPEDTQSEEDIIAVRRKIGVSFVLDPSGCVRLEVGQLFQNLHHFRQVICDFINERDRYTAKCTYEGCEWRIHASPIDDRRTFMIKTMEPQHICQKIHCIYEVSLPVWTLYRAKRRVLEKTEVVNYKSYSLLHTYGSIVQERNPGSMMKIKTATGPGCMSFEGVYLNPEINDGLMVALFMVLFVYNESRILGQRCRYNHAVLDGFKYSLCQELSTISQDPHFT